MPRIEVARKLPRSHQDGDMVGMRIWPGPEVKAFSGDAAYGKPVPMYRRTEALRHLRQMSPGIDTAKATQCISMMSEQIERDEPYEVLNIAFNFIDLTGAYRLMAVLLCAEKPRIRVPATTA